MNIRKHSIGNLRRPRACSRFTPVTMLGSSALMPMPSRVDDPRLRFPIHRVT